MCASLKHVYNYHTHYLYSPSMALHDCNSTIVNYFILSYIEDQQTSVWYNESYNDCDIMKWKTVKREQCENSIVSVECHLTVTLTGKSKLVWYIRLQETLESMHVFANNYPNQPLFKLSKVLRIAYQSSN